MSSDRVQIRQGDVLLIPISAPKEPKRVTDASGVPLAGLRVEGERTGHVHVLPSRVYEDDGNRVLFMERPDTMRHVVKVYEVEVPTQDHNPVEVPAGWWEVRVQREHNRPGMRD